MDTDKKYCLITGASKGIGKALAEECASHKMNLYLVSLPDSGLEELATQLQNQEDIDVETLSIDLTEKDAPLKVYQYSKKQNLVVDKIINNAGVGSYGVLEEQPPEEIDNIIFLNIRATTLISYYFLNDLKKLPKAHILNISSFASFIPFPKKSIYAASKSYILFFSRSLNAELTNTNIKVTSVHPNGVRTNGRIQKTLKNASLLARITTLDADQVAKCAVKGMINGKEMVIPGWATKFFYFLGSIVPYGFIVKIVGWAFKKA